jgi:putative heme-binding domain-containing protein
VIARRTTWVLGALPLTVAVALVAQAPAPTNPRSGDPAAISIGSGLFRERCAECHGADARGVAGHDLTRLWSAGSTDARVFETIRNGVPNTIMPSSSAPDAEVWALVSYLHSLSASASPDTRAGNSESGERIFWSTCGGCHAVSGRGGPLGPDLTRIAQGQSRESLVRSIRDPGASIPAGYQPVTLVTRDGRRIRGARKSEDAFSIQIMDIRGQLRGYLKADLRGVVREHESLMPAFGPDRMTDRDLGDVVLYLSTLRDTASSHP